MRANMKHELESVINFGSEERKSRSIKKKRKVEEHNFAPMRDLVDSYTKEIKDLKKELDELKEANKLYQKYTKGMVTNPVRTILLTFCYLIKY
jgi:predicted RNase H-like nuclease (RuvC/YqgF family)